MAYPLTLNGGTHHSHDDSKLVSLIADASSTPTPVASERLSSNQDVHYLDSVHSAGERLDASTLGAQQALLKDKSRLATEQDASLPYEKEREGSVDLKWLPVPLRMWFWIPFVVVLVLAAIGLEVALHFSNKNQGWESNGGVGNTESVLHYVYTLPPVIVAAILVTMWTWTDIEIKKLQPYVDLVHGDSPPHRSLLLDYTRHNNFFVWTRAAANKHYLVVLASLMALLSLSFQPLAAALLSVRNTWMSQPGVNVSNRGAISLNQNNQFNDLTAFLTASGYAGASVLYGLGDPPFIHQGYTVGLFDLPSFIVNNGSVIANTTAIKSKSNCSPVPITMNQVGTGWNNSMTFDGCSTSWVVDHNATSLFGTTLPSCDPQFLRQFSPIVFWFFTYETVPAQATATLCAPSIELWEVMATVDIATGNITDISEMGPFTSASNFSSLSANVTGFPLNSRAYNGLQFELSNPDEFVVRRLEAIQLQLPAAIFQAAVQSPDGVIGSFDANRFVGLANKVYTTYLALVASTVYFLPHTEPLVVEVKSFQQRVWLSNTAVHLLTTAMLLLAFFATLIQLFHRYDSRQLSLRHMPGTIASAVSIGAQTGMGELLAGRQKAEEFERVLRNKKFKIDPQTMKIIMEGEEGYESAASPRKSIFAVLQTRPRSFFFTQPPESPRSPDHKLVV
ncbi:hypothetical protein Ac2012v2_006994 [Leucoagaricus gongylophorus]